MCKEDGQNPEHYSALEGTARSQCWEKDCDTEMELG